MRPAKDSQESFRCRIKHFCNQLPAEYFPETIEFFGQAKSKAKNDYSKAMYQELIDQLSRTHQD